MSFKRIVLLLVFLAVAGCQDAGRPTLTPTPAEMRPTTSIPTPTGAATWTPGPAPTGTSPPPSTTPTPTPTPTPTASATATPEPLSLRFAVIGDYGQAGEPEAAVARLVKSWSPDLVITTGDNNYPDGAADTIDDNIGRYYAEFIHPYQGAYGPGADENRFFPSPGNHDWHAADLAPYLDYFSLPGNERYYDFVRGPVHFFALDSDSREPDGVNLGSAQAQWLRQRLAASTSPWKVVYMHHPPYSSAQHGNTDWMQWPFAEWGASAVLSGHDHVYEHLVFDGLDYFTVGLGGHPARYLFLLPARGSMLRYNDAHGAMLVEATEDELWLRFVNITGEEIDRVEIRRE
jgi:hypothetical protein